MAEEQNCTWGAREERNSSSRRRNWFAAASAVGRWIDGKDVDRDSPSSSSSAPSVVSNIEASSDWDAALAGIFSRRWESSLLGEEEGERGRFSASSGWGATTSARAVVDDTDV